MKITVHRGTKEIGGTCIEITDAGSRIILDIGMPLVDRSGGRFNMANYADSSGQDLVAEGVLPNLKGCYQWDIDEKKPDGILISHSHLDHHGLIPYLRNDVLYFMGKGTKRVLDLNGIFLGQTSRIPRYEALKSGLPIKIGTLTVTPYLMDHSAFDSYAFLVESDGKRVLYSGDFRGHGRKAKAFEWFLKNAPRGIDALLIEGSTLGREAKEMMSESALEKQLTNIARNTDGAVFGLSSAQNIDRIVSFFKAACASDRLFVVDVYLANILDSLKDLARLPHLSDTQFKNMRVVFTKHICDSLRGKGHIDLMTKFRKYRITKAEIAENPNRILMMIRSSMQTDMLRMGNLSGSALIYSMWSGYLSDPAMQRMVAFAERKAMVFHTVHTSGHASIPTIKRVIDTLQPKRIIPIHTFHPEAFHELSDRTVQAEDGKTINILLSVSYAPAPLIKYRVTAVPLAASKSADVLILTTSPAAAQTELVKSSAAIEATDDAKEKTLLREIFIGTKKLTDEKVLKRTRTYLKIKMVYHEV